MSFVFRQSPSGSVIQAPNDQDTILWDASTQRWIFGPGGGGGGAVSSVFGRAGAVTAQSGDYDSDQVDNVSGVPGAAVSDALDYLQANAGAVSNVFGRIGAVSAQNGDYTASQVTNTSAVAGVGVSGALNTLGTAVSGLVTGVSSVFGRTGGVAAANGDYTSSQVTDASALPGSSVSDSLNYLGGQAVGAVTGATPALDFAATRYIVLTLSANAVPTATVPPAGVECVLEVVQGSGPFSITSWPASVDWQTVASGGGLPSLSTVAGVRNIFKFVSNGTRLRGYNVGEF